MVNKLKLTISQQTNKIKMTETPHSEPKRSPLLEKPPEVKNPMTLSL